MLVAQPGGLAGDGDVHRLILQALLQGLGLQALSLRLDGSFQGGADLVGQLAHGGPFLGGQLAHALQNGGELPLLAQVLHPPVRPAPRGLGALQGGEGLGADVC